MADGKRGIDWTRLRQVATESYQARRTDQRGRRTFALVAGGGLALTLLVFGAFWAWAIRDLPQVPDQQILWSLNRTPGTTFLDAQGRTLGVRGALYGRRLRHRDLPDHVVNAFLAIEDQRFFEHRGVDRQGMLRAVLANMRAGHTVQGGSTITQQLVKNLFLTPERSLQRKLQELILAGRIEERLNKDEILDLYLNRVYLGEQAYGVDAAARRYFGKDASALTIAEAAMIAGLPKAPSENAPTRNLARARARQQVVLAAMVESGAITPAQQAEAAEAPIVLASRPPREGELGYVFDMALEEARKRAPETSADLVIRLTIDPGLQSAAVEAVRHGLGPAWKNERHPLQGALVLVDHDSAIRALVGGTSYAKSKFNRATQAKRQPGSSFKTFVFAAAIEQGMDPDTIRHDEPIVVQGWRPKNYHEGYMGAVTLRTAFAQSLNTVAAEVADEVGITRVADFACKFGVVSIPCTDESRIKRPIAPSIALGSMEVTLLEMTQAFSIFMRDGHRIDSYLVDRVENSRGDVLYQRPKVTPVLVYDPANVAVMNGMMARVVENGTGARARLPGRDVAGKTGTSQDWRDAWFVGYTADYACGVWVGYDDFAPMPRITGGGAPAAIWAELMGAASRDLPKRDLPGAEPPVRTARAEEMTSFFGALVRAFRDLGPDDDSEEER